MKNFKILTFLGITTIAFMLFLTTKTLNGQHSVSTMPKLITVTGSAEMSIVPDEVELSITIYSDRNNFEKYEKELTEICKKHGIPEAQLNFKNSLGHNEWYHWYWWWYYRNSSHLSQTYKLKINTKLDFLSLVKDMNKSWVQNINITSSSNKDLSEYRKEVKKEAMRMAKEKATYMLEAVGESIGSIVSVEEINADKNEKQFNGRPYPYYYYWDNPFYIGNGNGINSNSSMSSNSVMSASSSLSGTDNNQSGISGLSSIKLRYEVKAVFEIK
jgi:hypothetical protein